MVKLPPKTDVFEKNELFNFKRGFASKIPAQIAKDKYGLNPEDKKIVWLSPDGKSILDDEKAIRNNARRRSALTLSDSWKDLKSLDAGKAKEIGWNGFQKLLRNIQGSRIEVLKRLEKIGVMVDTLTKLSEKSQGEAGENNGWGDSG
jgi:hypothetical protein